MGGSGTTNASPVTELVQHARDLSGQARWAEAVTVLRRAVSLDPANPGLALFLGELLSKVGEWREGEMELRRGIALAPSSAALFYSLSQNLLAQGRYKEAWPLYRAKAALPEFTREVPRNFPFPRWNGESLAGKRIVLFPEQGLGDQIQFARFIPGLLAQAGGVTLLTRSSLARLFQHNLPGIEIVIAEGAAKFTDPDYWAMLSDLPALLGVEVDTIPARPYLKSPVVGPDLGDGFKIGLKTRGSPAHGNDRQRSLPADLAGWLKAQLPGKVISLEPDESGVVDMADTAAIVEQLDLVVSVDTSVAHLAGAMGKPCLVLVPGFSSDWRWLAGRTDSPWYPHHRLFRGNADGGWMEALDQVIAETRARAAVAPTVTASGSGPAILMRRALSLRADGRFTDAIAVMRDAVDEAPGDSGLLTQLGAALAGVGRLDEAETCLRRALDAAPAFSTARYALGLVLLGKGNYAEGGPLYATRTEIPFFKKSLSRDVKAPRWRGEDLAGKRVAILPEQGLGDAIQFARFLPRLQETGAQVRLFAHPGLVDLFRSSFPDMDIIAAAGDVQLGQPDYWTTLVDMAGPLGATNGQFPAPPYLHTDRTQPKLGSGFTVGLQTAGNPNDANDAWRSLSPKDAAALRAGLPGHVVDLDPQASGARDFADTAAIIAGLDLVVSVDTSVAHLAGALGKPCLLLVSSVGTDWRWIRNRDESPWYPNHRLFWGEVEGGWSAAIERLVAEARRRMATPVSPSVKRAAAGRESLRDMLLRGQGLCVEGRYSEALDLFRRALRLAPDNPAALSLLGVALLDIGRLKEAEGYQRRVLAQVPDHPSFQNSLSLNLLAQGRYREAWPLHEGRSGKDADAIGFPTDVPSLRWRGEPLEGKHIAVMPEQGFGDAIQFFRFLPRLAATGAQITLFVQPALTDLFAASIARTPILAGITLRPAVGEVRLGNPDYWTTLVDMMRPLGITIDDVSSPPYLFTDRNWPPLEGGFTVGIVTRGNSGHVNDKRRSLAPDMAARLERGLPGRIVSLDPTVSGARDFDDTAALIQRLDLVVSVDTSVAHLAGALGKTCLLLVPGIGTDWRWMRDRDDSPWYSKHRLFRSSNADGSWPAAIDAAIASARAICARG